MTVATPGPWPQVAEIVRLLRTGQAATRPRLIDLTGLGRNAVAARLRSLEGLGLVEVPGGRSGPGRNADRWSFRASRGAVLVALIDVESFRVAVMDLAGDAIEVTDVEWHIPADPEAGCAVIAEALDQLRQRHSEHEVWALTIGMPAPVDPHTGGNADPIRSTGQRPRWSTDFDVRSWFANRFDLHVRIESVSNLFALGAATGPGAPADLISVRVSFGLGGGLVSKGRLLRGARYLAGEIPHVKVRADSDRICPCGRVGCLATYAGSRAMLSEAQRAIAQGLSHHLADISARRALTVVDLVEGAATGDPTCVEILVRAGDAVGVVTGGAVNWFNPAAVIIGGPFVPHSPAFQMAFRRALESSTLDASLQSVTIRFADLADLDGVRGGAEFAVDALLSADALSEWGPLGSPTLWPSRLRNLDTD